MDARSLNSVRGPNAGSSDSATIDKKENISREKIGYSLFSDLISFQSAYEQSAVVAQPLIKKAIPAPLMDPDTATVFMGALISSVNESDYKGKMQIIVSNMKTSDKINEEIFKKMTSNIKKAEEMAIQKKAAKVGEDVALGFMTAGAIVGLIGAILLTAFSLGGGTAVLVGAGIGLTQTLMSVADRIAEATDAKWEKSDGTKTRVKISWEGMMERILDDPNLIPNQIKNKGPDAVAQYKQIATMAVSIMMTISCIAASIACGVSGISKSTASLVDVTKKATSIGAKIGTQIANKAATASEIFSNTSEVVGGISTVVSAGYGISIAFINFDMKEADNQKNFLAASNEAISKFLDSQRDGIAQNIQSMGDTYETLSSIVSDVREVNERSAASIGRA